MGMTAAPAVDPAQRADWLRILAMSTAPVLAGVCVPVLADFRFESLRPAEQGLVMVRARIGNRGDRFNIGETTVTRCVVLHRPEAGAAVAGVGHVLGLDKVRAERIAQVDALLQVPDLQVLLSDRILQPLRKDLERRQRIERERTEATRVRFFTLQAEAL
jgi:alpha-D-ribose 1-methylphosphonate 5-triphosphate synthase subunit PhnG